MQELIRENRIPWIHLNKLKSCWRDYKTAARFIFLIFILQCNGRQSNLQSEWKVLQLAAAAKKFNASAVNMINSIAVITTQVLTPPKQVIVETKLKITN